jgi:hypothetical protein
LELKIPKDVVSRLLGPAGLINILPMIPINELPKGVQYIRAMFDEEKYTAQFDTFWTYFKKVWLKKYDSNLWNISGLLEDDPNDLINRTNNPLERYNRTLNKAFPEAHPSVIDFVRVIRSEGQRYVRKYEEIKRGRRARQHHLLPTLFTVPQSYYDFNYVAFRR